MKYGFTDIDKLDDWALTLAYENCSKARKEREKASQHDKFNRDGWSGDKKKMEFPPINPEFEKLELEILNEIKKRNLL